MIFYLLRGDHATMAYVSSWGPSPGSRMRFLPYEELVSAKAPSVGTYLFTDLETLTPGQLRLADAFCQQLLQTGNTVRILNNPGKVLRRLELLQKLHEAGVNRFRALRATSSLEMLHFPVFVRREDDHKGPLTPLLDSQSELRRRLRYLQLQGHRLRDLLVIEYCHTADGSGLFRKYSAFIVGDRILPRHVIFGYKWILKQPELANEDTQAETQIFLETNPHERRLREIFHLANIDYGRADYSVAEGAVQVWEINTHPTVHSVTPRLTAAFECVDSECNNAPPVRLYFERCTVRDAERDARKRKYDERLRNALSSIGSNPVVVPLKRLVQLRLSAA